MKKHIIVILSATALIQAASAQALYHLAGAGASAANNWQEIVYSTPTSPNALSPNPKPLYCAHFGATSIADYTTNNQAAGGSGALLYSGWTPEYVSTHQGQFIDSFASWGYPDVANLDLWKFSMMEYIETYLPVFNQQLSGVATTAEQWLITEVAHEASPAVLGDVGGPGNFDLLSIAASDIFFQWAIGGSTTLYGTTYHNTVGVWTSSYDNPDLEVTYYNYESELSGVPQSPQMQDHIGFNVIPEPAFPAMAAMAAGACALIRKRRNI